MFFLVVLLAAIPSLLWLLFFLHKDVHPEPKWMIRRAFLYGMGVTLIAAGIEILIQCPIVATTEACTVPFFPAASLPFLLFSQNIREILFIFLGVALVEEALKYLAVRWSVMHKPGFDEPVDAMVYMVVAALGFATVENILAAAGQFSQGALSAAGAAAIPAEARFAMAVDVIGARAVSATLLHALASGIIGYMLARSFFSSRPRHFLVGSGILIATLVHGVYNSLIRDIILRGDASLAFPLIIILLVVTAKALFLMFHHVRKLSAEHTWKNIKDHAQQTS